MANRITDFLFGSGPLQKAREKIAPDPVKQNPPIIDMAKEAAENARRKREAEKKAAPMPKKKTLAQTMAE